MIKKIIKITLKNLIRHCEFTWIENGERIKSGKGDDIFFATKKGILRITVKN